MTHTRYNAFEDAANVKRIDELRKTKDFYQLMNFFYGLLKDNPTDIFTSVTSTKDEKLESLEHTINFFASIEEYEKCEFVKKLRNQLNESV